MTSSRFTPARPAPPPSRVLGRSLSLVAAAALALFPAAAAAQAGGQGGGQAGPQLIRDTEVEEIIHQESDPVFVAAGVNPRTMQILIVQGEMNAGTYSNLAMSIGTKLIEETENPNQLIGVMAHETGHAAGGHTVRGQAEMARAGLAPMIISAGLGLLALAFAPEAGIALLTSSPYFGALNSLSYSRDQEARADQAGITYLEKSGQSGRGLVEFFDKFRYEEVFSEARRYKFFVDHPVSGDRIELLRRRAEEQPHFKTPDSPAMIARHEIMKAKLHAFIDAPQQTFIAYKETDASFPARYARAIAYYRALETDRALKLVDGLIVDYPADPYLYELKGQIYFESARPHEAEQAHAKSVALKPDAPLLQINLAQAILAQDDGKRADEAIPHLQRALALEKDSPFAWTLMAQAYDAKGDGGQARLASAEARFAVGDMKQARIFAMRARGALPKNTPEWRRATDIVLASNPSENDLKMVAEGGRG